MGRNRSTDLRRCHGLASLALRSGLAMMLLLGPAIGCNVPVFRFALERWVSDNYVLVVAHKSPLNAAEKSAIAGIQAASTENGGHANITVQVVDVVATPDDPAIEHLPLETAELPAAFLFYPPSFGEPTIAWKAPLTTENLTRMICSPLRDDLIKRMVAGCTAVWVLLESGDKKADDEAEQVLRESLAMAGQDLKLPPGVAHPSGEITGDDPTSNNGYFDAENQLESHIPLKIDFDTIRMPATDPNEQVLLALLFHSAPDLLAKRGRPMVFPIFGRGRALTPLVGDEIQKDAILAAAAYLCGPCSCQVKAQNPGVDMLLDTDWLSKLAGSTTIPERELPPLSGAGDVVANGKPAAAAAVAQAAQAPDHGFAWILRALGQIAIATTAVVLVVTVIMQKKT